MPQVILSVVENRNNSGQQFTASAINGKLILEGQELFLKTYY